MLNRYDEIKEFLKAFYIDEIVDLMPGARDQRRLDMPTMQCEDFNSIKKS